MLSVDIQGNCKRTQMCLIRSLMETVSLDQLAAAIK